MKFDFAPPRKLDLLNPDEIFERADQKLLEALKEDGRLERKCMLQRDVLGEYISMWANTPPDGGLLVIGIGDGGTVYGCSSLSAKQTRYLEDPSEACPGARALTKRLAVTLPDGDQDHVILIRVPYRPDRVVRTVKREAFIRRFDQKRRLTPEELRELAIDKGEVDFEQEDSLLTFPDDFDIEAIRGFAESVRTLSELETDVSDVDLLKIKHLGRETGGRFVPNVACALLFAREPDRPIPGCKIRFLRFEGEHEGSGERFNAVKDIWIEGRPVPGMIHEAERVLDAQVRTFSVLGKDGKFMPTPEYPKHAWYEAIVNACVHRSYANGLRNVMIFVKMFDDRIEIESPGPFPPLVTPENIYGMSHPRNPKLMQAMYFLKFVKMAAEGTRRMRDTMALMNLPPPEFSQKEIGGSRVRVTLRNNIHLRREWIDTDAAATIGAAIASSLNEREKRIINFVAEHQKINVSEAVRLTGSSWDTAKKLLTNLAKRGILEHHHRDDIERDPAAHYRLPGSGAY